MASADSGAANYNQAHRNQLSLAEPIGTRDSCPLINVWLLLMLALKGKLTQPTSPSYFLLHHFFLHVLAFTVTSLSSRSRKFPLSCKSLHKDFIYDNNALMAILSPTERLIYYQLEFLLLCFASEFNSLVQFFQSTNNICLKKGLFMHVAQAN